MTPKKPEIPTIEISGTTCASLQKRRKAVFSPDGKSRWYVTYREMNCPVCRTATSHIESCDEESTKWQCEICGNKQEE